MKLTFQEFQSWYTDQLLNKALESKDLESIKQIMAGKFSLKILAFGQEIEIEFNPVNTRTRALSSGSRFKPGDQIKWGNNPTIWEVTENGLKHLDTGQVMKPSHVSMREMALEQKVSVESLQSKYPKGISGLSNPKWHLA